jgi:hypothetical protein
MLPNTQHLVFDYQIVVDIIIMLPNTQHLVFYYQIVVDNIIMLPSIWQHNNDVNNDLIIKY